MTTVIIPTKDEAANIELLANRLVAACSGFPVSVQFVDDSTDMRTVDAIRRVAAMHGSDRLRIGWQHRTGARRHGGLAGAVIDGLRDCDSEHVAVMDGDLQHPPELLPALLRELTRGADISIASRYCEGGRAEGLRGTYRHLVSKRSTMATKRLFPVALSGVTDPLTGFFAMRRAAIDVDSLKAEGFKILLEILVRHPRLVKREIPLAFASRHAGDSKASLRHGVAFAWQLAALRMGSDDVTTETVR
jgi:dolichol-phosphate mannosyltransferase